MHSKNVNSFLMTDIALFSNLATPTNPASYANMPYMFNPYFTYPNMNMHTDHSLLLVK